MLIGVDVTEGDSSPGGAPRREPFLMWLDHPHETTVASEGLPMLRVEGWVASVSQASVSVRALVGGETVVEVSADQSRDDVLALVPELLPDVARVDGFRFHVPLPAPLTSPATVRIEVTDGDVVGSVDLEVVPSDDERPPRADYKATWNAAAGDEDSAKVSVSGYTDEAEYSRMAELTVSTLESTIGVKSDDVFLEIGAGVGRVGSVLATRCRRWIATDVSGRMLEYASQRLAHLDNVEFVEISGWDLAPIADESVDAVYCTVVFMHLDEWERYRYVTEGMRILKPAGASTSTTSTSSAVQGGTSSSRCSRGTTPSSGRPTSASRRRHRSSSGTSTRPGSSM